ncbi:inorganic pyrophosphatase [Allokutzneria oryzae]|uniref:Inorganic pyrophosphatase n=1 Tax=Allokutzneria oryzae TaxID=1378989 RepID=A0ABV6AB01_9PSEU
MPDFFAVVDDLVRRAGVVVERRRGSAHPRFPDAVYPVDYGHVPGTAGGDGAELDAFLGTAGGGVRAALVTADPGKGDVEVKLLVGCSPAEEEAAERFLRDTLRLGVHRLARP